MKYPVYIQNIVLAASILLAQFTPSLFAVDEEYFIPYTDNYGYEYDPNSGTYIKKEPPESTVEQTTEQVSKQNINTLAVVQPEISVMDENIEDEGVLIPMPVFIASLVGILAIFMFLAKFWRKQRS